MNQNVHETEYGAMLARLRFHLERPDGAHVEGFVFDPQDLNARFVVELVLDGVPGGLTRAELFSDNLLREGFGDGCYRFQFSLDPAAFANVERVEVRLSNMGIALGSPIALTAAPLKRADVSEVVWAGGLRFSGWLSNGDDQTIITAVVEGEPVAETLLSTWRQVGGAADGVAVRAFDLHLPESYADGVPRRIHFWATGREIVGSPLPFVAFPNGLQKTLAAADPAGGEDLRAQMFDRLLPQSWPFDQFAEWRKRFSAHAEIGGETATVALVMVGDDPAAEVLKSVEQQVGVKWLAAVMSGGGQTALDPAGLIDFLEGEGAGVDACVFALSSIVLAPRALAALANALRQRPEVDVAYCDLAVRAKDGGEWPIAFPDYDRERALEQGYPALLFAMRREQALRLAKSGAGDLFALFLSAAPLGTASNANPPCHLPEFLAVLPPFDVAEAAQNLARASQERLRVAGVAAVCEPTHSSIFPAVRVRRLRAPGSVSILIPTRDRLDLLEPCIESLRATVDLERNELIVIDNDSCDQETIEYLEAQRTAGARVIRSPGFFNFSALVNAGASIANRDNLLLLNNDVEAIEEGWLQEMASRLEPDVGAVGVKLIWPSGLVQHGGVVLGPYFAASHAFNDTDGEHPGYADMLCAARECSAVTAACLLTPRALFHRIGGFDAVHFPVNFNDVDYCLKARELGLRIVFTPRTQLIHRESASRGTPTQIVENPQFKRELGALRARWFELADGRPLL